MKIVVLQGSPNETGSTAILAEEFAGGARGAGHDVSIVNVASLDIAPCTGCVACGYGGPCALYDDFDSLREDILAADMLVFATPLYYYGMTAQLKAVVDRFCSANPSISGKRLKSALLTVAWNADSWTFDALESHYDTLVRYLNLQDCGRVLGKGCGTPGMTRQSGYPNEARKLGASLQAILAPRHLAGRSYVIPCPVKPELTQVVREFTRAVSNGMAELPPGPWTRSVDYSLTEAGRDLLPALNELYRWGKTHMKD